jgi:hypothetical protein
MRVGDTVVLTCQLDAVGHRCLEYTNLRPVVSKSETVDPNLKPEVCGRTRCAVHGHAWWWWWWWWCTHACGMGLGIAVLARWFDYVAT